LEQSLQKNYNINIKEDIQSFCQIINDFKEKGYCADDKIQEYSRSLSLKLEIKKLGYDKYKLITIRIKIVSERSDKFNIHYIGLLLFALVVLYMPCP